jgi:signal peptidase I
MGGGGLHGRPRSLPRLDMSSALPIESPVSRALRVPVRAGLRSLSPRIVLSVAVLALVGFAFGYLGSWPPLATVMSGSMAPTIKTGDMVVFKRLDGLPHKGDIVAVSVPADARSRYGYPPEVIHRVVSVGADGTITTKGDARPHNDPFTVGRSEVNAKVVAHVPAAGRVIAFLMSPMGLLWIAGGAVMLFAVPLLERRHETERAEQDLLADMREELRTISSEIVRLRTEPPVVVREPAPPPRVVAEPAPKALDPPEFMPGYLGLRREPAAPEPVAAAPEPTAAMPEPAAAMPEPAAADPAQPVASYVVRRRSGGLLGRFR